MNLIETSSPPRVRSQDGRFSETYLHESAELPELAQAPFGGMICRVEPGGATDEDRHNQEEMFVVTAGDGWLRTAEEVVAISAGDVFTLPRHVPHVIENVGDEVFTFVSVWWPRVEPQSGASA